jgi:hypothetical protein
VIAVEPAQGDAPPETTSASGSSPAPTAEEHGDSTKIAAADSKGTEENVEAADKAEAPLDEATRQELAQDILSELKRLGCYFGSTNTDWTARSKSRAGTVQSRLGALPSAR